MKLTHILPCLILSCFASYGQEKKAETRFDNYAYSDAIESYETLVKKGHSSTEIYENLGNANYFNANYDEAAKWYGKLLELENTTIDAEYYYKYAQALKSLKKYEESDNWMVKFDALKEKDNRGKLFSQQSNYMKNIKENSGRYSIENSYFNSNTSDFAPSFNGSQLVFSSAKDSGIASKKIHNWNGMSFLDLYTVPISEDDINSESIIKLSKTLNKKTHESSTAFTKDGSTIYFTRNNSKKGSFARDDQGISRLKIYKASLVNNQWKNVTELPFNNDEYSVAHPTLSPDESKLYFASDMPGTVGASDIFYVTINEDGSYSEPINLGKKVNTEARETFPYITASNKLYFASDGHPGLGGLDVFAVDLNNLEETKVQNVGSPLNSENDDFSFIFNEENQKGYFASNREGGRGADDIYNFTESSPLNFSCSTIVTGVVKDKKTNAVLPDTRLTVLNPKGEKIGNTISESNGNYTFKLDCYEGDFTLIANKANYKEENNKFKLSPEKDENIVNVLLASSLEKAKTGNDLTKTLNLEPIYFDFDKSYIRRDAKVVMEKVVDYLNQYPDAMIQIGSHTDSRANDNYNLALSKKRAESTRKYLISQGINANRLTAEGFGETKLTNNCDNSSSCSSEAHQKNRRSEFIIK